MRLKELGQEISKVFIIEDTLKMYCYENKLEFIDYTPEYKLPNGAIITESYAHFLTLNIKDNKVSCIENSSLTLITPSNKNMIKYLADLIGVEIEDYNDYSKLLSIKYLECIDIKLE